ncbi:unnamed protein product [Amoebophrya sp. A120]|nr:unnamed protein product [Amoebophrya sp. A120]|eukprot:GSA120T00012442001.1
MSIGAAMELDDSNKAQIKRLYQFLRQKRDRHLREVDDIVTDLKDDRCAETIYNQEDVVTLLDEFAKMIKEVVKLELDTVTNMMALHTADLFAQAQSRSVQLGSDLSVVEDEARLAKIAELAEWQGTAGNKPAVLASLGSAAAGGSSDELVKENQMLQERYQSIQKQLSEMMSERSALKEELAQIKTSFSTIKDRMGADLQSTSMVKDLEGQLKNTKMLLDSKASEAEKAREDLTRRLGDSSQFKDLKNIVAKKNQTIKQLRERLRQYEGDGDDDGDILRE